jgi:hypothetical protein
MAVPPSMQGSDDESVSDGVDPPRDIELDPEPAPVCLILFWWTNNNPAAPCILAQIQQPSTDCNAGPAPGDGVVTMAQLQDALAIYDVLGVKVCTAVR